MTGFFFANRHSSEFDVVAMEDASRGLLPSLRRNDVEASGRDGTINFGNETYNTRQIVVKITFISKDERQLQILAREIAHWLSGRGILYFDDEPERAYDAVIYEAVNTDQIIRAKRARIVFECQPFAKSRTFRQSINPGILHGHTLNIDSQGTQPTHTSIVILQNTGTVAVNNITITRRALHR